MMDNGAFSAFTRGFALDVDGFYGWIEPHLRHPHWAVVPDSIDGDLERQIELEKTWPFSKHLGAPVFHMHEPLDRLRRLCDSWPRVCIGSSGQFWQIGSDAWVNRMDEIWGAIPGKTWVHMLRAMSEASVGPWPFASADSTNLARNASRDGVVEKSRRINGTNPVPTNHKQGRLL